MSVSNQGGVNKSAAGTGDQHGRVAGIKYTAYGAGAPLFLFHGFGGKPADWHFLVEDLSPHFRVVIPHLSNLTLSESETSFREQVDLLVDFIKQLTGAEERVVVLGASYGGALAWAVNAVLGERIREAVYINPMPPYPARYLQNGWFRPFLFLGRYEWLSYTVMGTPPGKNLVRYLLEVFYDEWPERVDSVGRLTERHRRLVARIVRRFNEILHSSDWRGWTSRIKAIKSPSLLIVGGQERLFRPLAYQNLCRYLGNCEVVTIDQLSHRVSKTVAPQIADLIYRRFLGK